MFIIYRFKLTEDDVYSVWHTLSELLETRKSAKTTTTLVIIKPSICQVILSKAKKICKQSISGFELTLNLMNIWYFVVHQNLNWCFTGGRKGSALDVKAN